MSLHKLTRGFIFLFLLIFSSVNVWAQSKDQVYILCYHTWLGKSSISTDFSVAEFKIQMQKIKDLGYTFVSWKDIVSNRVSGSKNILITIDDGNKSLLPAYNQVLKPMNIKPILFIYPAIIGNVHYALKYYQLKELMLQGVDIGAHGYHHEFVKTKLFRADPKAFWREIKTAKSVLEQNLFVPILTYAYPFGSYDELTVQSLEQSKYLYAFKLGNTPQALPLPRDGSQYLLTRYLMTRGAWKGIYTELKQNAALEL